MAAAQALDFHSFNNGQGVKTAKKVIRKYVEHLDVDRPLHKDHTRMKELVKSCEILNEVEKEIGSLEDLTAVQSVNGSKEKVKK
jgi:histidine ammonia-lyase